jgi:hypothetical protein
MTQTAGVGEKIERVAKILGALVAICGAVMGASSWAFTTAMASRDRQIADLSHDITKLQESIDRSSSVNAEKIDKMSNDITNLRIAVIASRAEVDLRESPDVPVTFTTTQRNKPRTQSGSTARAALEQLVPARYNTHVNYSDGLIPAPEPVLEPVVTVGRSTVLIDNAQTARQVFDEAIEQVSDDVQQSDTLTPQ